MLFFFFSKSKQCILWVKCITENIFIYDEVVATLQNFFPRLGERTATFQKQSFILETQSKTSVTAEPLQLLSICISRWRHLKVKLQHSELTDLGKWWRILLQGMLLYIQLWNSNDIYLNFERLDVCKALGLDEKKHFWTFWYKSNSFRGRDWQQGKSDLTWSNILIL